MNELLKVVLLSFVSGITIIIGGLIARFLHVKKKNLKKAIIHFAIAFGGGILISAVAFALVPKAMEQLDVLPLIFIFLGGTLFFMFLDYLIARKGGSAAQLMAMLMDYIPEALALGASFAHDPRFGFLLALFIGLQNLPEGFNAYGELTENMRSRKVLWLLFALSFTGIFAAVSGHLWLSEMPKTVAGIMLFAGGGILYLMFQDIAPLAKMKKSMTPATGASVGFLIGMLGEKLL